MPFLRGLSHHSRHRDSEMLSVRLPQVDGTFIQMEDEIASLGAVIGASLAGVKSMTATSGPGFSLMQENLGFAVIAEVPCVVVNVMRGGPSTGCRPSPLRAMSCRPDGGRMETIPSSCSVRRRSGSATTSPYGPSISPEVPDTGHRLGR